MEQSKRNDFDSGKGTRSKKETKKSTLDDGFNSGADREEKDVEN